MNASDPGPFDELAAYEFVVAFEARDERLDGITSQLPDGYVEVNLGCSDQLKKAFVEHFKLSELPAVLMNGCAVTGNLKERIEEQRRKKEAAVIERIHDIIDPSLVTVFIKGSLSRPKCGFTRTLVDILHCAGLRDECIRQFDILSDEGIRAKLKEINCWPTFPQVYIKGKFVGGLDVIKEMDRKDKLRERIADITGK